jgi:hypothetical protein
MKEKLTTGTSDRPKNETVAQTGGGLPDDSGPIIDVATDGSAIVRPEENDQPEPEGNPAGENHHHHNEDQGGRGMPGAEEIAGAGAEEDTYD